MAWKGGKLGPALSPNEVPKQRKYMCRGKSRDQPKHTFTSSVYCLYLLVGLSPSVANWANSFCFLSSLPFLPQPQPPQQCLTPPTCHLSTLNLHCVAGVRACLSIMTGEVSWEPKKSVGFLVYYSCIAPVV